MADARSPLELLRYYEQRALERRTDESDVAESAPEWQGLAFRIGETTYLASMDEVVEILDPPSFTRVPGTQPWFLGLGNVRGNLLPVSDLHGYVLGGKGSSKRSARVLTCGHGENYAGLKVDDVLGLRRFFLDEKFAAEGGVMPALVPHVHHTFRRHGQNWPVLDLKSLTSSDEFLRIGM
jgi:twitching motility protein PilI